MQLQLIRNATVKLTYAGKCLLMDPYLGEKGSGPSYAGKNHSPLVSLPIPLETILAGVEAVVVSHIHSDHFDTTARETLPKQLPLFCQPGDASVIHQMAFLDVIPVEETFWWEGIQITRTPGRHGSGEVLHDMGQVSGFLFQAPGEPTVFWTGDTVLTDDIQTLIRRESPEVILTHSCGAVWGDGVLILMDDHQTVEVCRLAPDSTVIAIHMEAVDHATVTRKQLRETARSSGISDEKLLIPLNGETITK
ncbi:MAG: MBL fold metallo-hydrolase [Bacillota bacterium]|nr:MBL fold metallo-hydrolase [Bacillota bacterium]